MAKEANTGFINSMIKRLEFLSQKAAYHDQQRAKYDEAAAQVQKAINTLQDKA